MHDYACDKFTVIQSILFQLKHKLDFLAYNDVGKKGSRHDSHFVIKSPSRLMIETSGF